MNPTSTQPAHSPWPHRLAMLLVAATVTLIFAGGLVTTTESGMAVPDWPTTFGYGMFSFPLDQWLGSGWKLFIEHAHRLLGSTVGLITIAYLISLFCSDKRRWMWALGALTLAAVIFQGILGGTRVIENARTLAMVHGCFAPIFLCMCVGNAVLTSRRWRLAFEQRETGRDENSPTQLPDPLAHARRGAFLYAAGLLTLVAYLQIVFGAQLRHLPADASAATGVTFAIIHVVTAIVVTLFIIGIGVAARRLFRAQDIAAIAQHQPITGVRKSAHWLGILVFVQIVLGCGTWLFNYGWPSWLSGSAVSEDFLIWAQDFRQTFITTAHQTTGSIILATAMAMTLRAVAATEAVSCSLASGARKPTSIRTTAEAGSPITNAVSNMPILAGGRQ